MFVKLFRRMFKKQHIKHINDSIIIKLWKSYNEVEFDPFSNRIFNGVYCDLGRVEFYLNYEGKHIPICNNQIDSKGDNLFHITGVNTYEYCRGNGLTNLLLAWDILYLMNTHKNSDFTIFVIHGAEIKQIYSDTGKFVYYRIFEKENKNVNNDFVNSCSFREFKKETRNEDYLYFQNLYNEIKEKILAEADESYL